MSLLESKVTRVRDLVHGFVNLTELERAVVDHKLFQRLRHVRQNDVAFFVYPSLNTTRFEHSLGVCAVAGRMAENVMRGSQARAYLEALNLSEEDFEQTCRLYGLLHDVGHLPFSHLFEAALKNHLGGSEQELSKHYEEWFGTAGCEEPHEALGASLAEKLVDQVEVPVPPKVKDAVLELMRTKRPPPKHPMVPIKQMIASDVDADRADSVRRDGRLAGGEYGTYDLDRLCRAVFVQQRKMGWRLAFSYKAVSSIESLLLERYRTYNWVHFHPRVIALKAAAGLLIAKLLDLDRIKKDSFPLGDVGKMTFRDDVWLWNVLRKTKWGEDHALEIASGALFHRRMERVNLLWRHRVEYHEWQSKLNEQAELEDHDILQDLDRKYEVALSKHLKKTAVVWKLLFTPVKDRSIYLTDELGDENVEDSLQKRSMLVRSLPGIWEGEPRYHVVLFDVSKEEIPEKREEWLEFTADWLRQA